MENGPLFMILFLAIVVMAAYYYVQRAKRRDVANTVEKDQPPSA